MGRVNSTSGGSGAERQHHASTVDPASKKVVDGKEQVKPVSVNEKSLPEHGVATPEKQALARRTVTIPQQPQFERLTTKKVTELALAVYQRKRRGQEKLYNYLSKYSVHDLLLARDMLTGQNLWTNTTRNCWKEALTKSATVRVLQALLSDLRNPSVEELPQFIPERYSEPEQLDDAASELVHNHMKQGCKLYGIDRRLIKSGEPDILRLMEKLQANEMSKDVVKNVKWWLYTARSKPEQAMKYFEDMKKDS